MPLFPPFNLPEGVILLITDGLAAPADFVLHRCLASHLKEKRKPKAIILSVSEGIGRWKALASKSNVNLERHLDSGSLEFIEVLGDVQAPSTEGGNSLKAVLNCVKTSLNRAVDNSKIVILDDISMLEWIGFTLIDVIRFARALRAVCLKANATLFVRHHIVTPNEPDEVFRHLLQTCTYHLEVLPLASGRSGTVSGEVALHIGFSAPSETVKLIPRSAALQYRLTDIGPDFFAKGTSEGVL
ncbi:hypothetical protein GALMADRAFT_128199 [Galerina marginata CBS 339.88]|uniref:Elongator complex protein 5 n=1 Tax=Galerina marginata (strain CBS 339.88) TaxID=685588 RepID=A0A067SQU0_GALM3|nr:hypothetical protein GALMADRAFT_128199 [Galerina marginata CBS 339.88]